MAVRRTAATAPVRQKLRKNHGPKRKMFHDHNATSRILFGKLGLLDKYHNFDSFTLALNARGIKDNLKQRWDIFYGLPMEEKRKYFKNLTK